ncbi:hypothetical protein HDV00_002425 [Rhizophlyctis rosea]|nr:hypothetical protein HDV00_002425 [Rhizophlyctis rosea]
MRSMQTSDNNESDEDVEELIKEELARLDQTDALQDYNVDAHPVSSSLEVVDDRGLETSTSWTEELRPSPSIMLRAEDDYGLERLTSWQDYLDTISSRDAERQAIMDDVETTEFLLSELRPNGVLAVEQHAREAPEPEPPDHDVDVAEPDMAINEQLAREEAELAERLRELHATTKSEQAILDALNAEAVEAGIKTDVVVVPVESVEASKAPVREEGAGKKKAEEVMEKEQRKPSGMPPDIVALAVARSSFGSNDTIAAVEAEESDLIDQHTILTNQIRTEAGEQARLQFRLDSLATQKAVIIRTLRQTKDKLRQLQEKERTLFHWLTHDAKSAYDREKDRSAVLIGRAQALAKKMKKEQEGLKVRLVGWKGEGEGLIKRMNDLTINHTHLIDQYTTAQQDLTTLQSELSAQSTLLDHRRAERDRLLLKKLQQEEATRQLEVELLIKAAHRQRPDRVVEFNEIEFLEAIGVGLRKIPDLSDAANIRHINFDDNLLSATKGLEVLKNLKTLSLSVGAGLTFWGCCAHFRIGNQYSAIDMRCFVLLRSLNAASNQIVEVQNADKCERLQLLNLNFNPLRDVAFLQSVRTLQVLSLGGTQIQNFQPVSNLTDILYLDLSSNRIHNLDLKFLATCAILQCLNLTDNFFTVMPVVPCMLVTDLEVGGNKIEELKIEAFSPTLRYINLNNNQLRKVSPLVNCMFLQELHLQNNLLSELTDIYSISLCQELRVLDLRKNPVVHDRHFGQAMLILLPSLQVLNGDWIERGPDARPDHLRIVKWCRRAWVFLNPSKEEVEDKDQTLQLCDDYLRIISSQRRNIASFMGPTYTPYPQYLSAPQNAEPQDATSSSALEETRIGWMTSTLTQNLAVMRDLRKHKRVNFDVLLLPWVEEIGGRIWYSSVVYTQARWRMILARRRRLKCIFAARLIQLSYRRYKKRQRSRSEKAKGEEAVRKHEVAAVKIQKVIRGFTTRKRFDEVKDQLRAAKVVRERQALRRRAESRGGVREGVGGLSGEHEVEDIDPDLQSWLATAHPDTYDHEMHQYLQDETLHHFSRPGTRPTSREQHTTNIGTGQTPFTDTHHYPARVPSPHAHHPTEAESHHADAPRTNILSHLFARRAAAPALFPGGDEAGGGEGVVQADGEANAGAGWKFETDDSRHLWDKQRDRYTKQENKAKVREMMKDPANRLKAFQRLQASQTNVVESQSRGRSAVEVEGRGDTEMVEKKRVPNIVYAWDVGGDGGMDIMGRVGK